MHELVPLAVLKTLEGLAIKNRIHPFACISCKRGYYLYVPGQGFINKNVDGVNCEECGGPLVWSGPVKVDESLKKITINPFKQPGIREWLNETKEYERRKEMLEKLHSILNSPDGQELTVRNILELDKNDPR